MRRSIQIVSAYAILLAAAGPVTGFSGGLAAEGDKLPCNHFCRTWMGYEGGEAAAPQPSPDETVTVKPAEVSREPEPPADDPVPRSVKAKAASQTDSEAKPTRSKQKRKAEPDTADVLDQRSPGARSKASKLAKNPKPDVDALSDPRSSSESSPRRSRAQADDSVRKPSHDRDATSSEATKVTAREVPLPPRLPRAGRAVRTGVAQAGSNKVDETRASDGVGQPASPMSPKAPPSVAPTLTPDVAQDDVPHPAKGAVATAAAKPTTKTDTAAAKGVVGDNVAVSPAPLAGRNVAPAVDARQDTSPAVPRTEDPHRVAPESAEANAKQSPGAVDVSPTSESQSPAGRVVAPASSEDTIAAGTASQAVMPSSVSVSAVTGEADSKALPNTAVQTPAVTVERPVVVPAPSPSEARAVVSLSNPDKGASQTATTPAAAVKTGEAAPKAPATAPDQGAAIGTTAAPSLPEDRAVGVASDPETQPAGVASQALSPPPAVVITGAAALKDAPTIPQGAAVGGTTAAPSLSEGRAVEATSDPDMQAAGVASPASVPPPAVVTAGAVASKDAPTTPQGAAVVGTAAAPSLSEGRAVEAASGPSMQAAGVDSPALVPPSAVVISGAVAPNDAPTTLQGAAVVGTVAAPSRSEGRAVEAASEPDTQAAAVASQVAVPPPAVGTAVKDTPTSLVNGPAANVGAVESTAAATDASRSAGRDDAGQPVVASSKPPAPAVSSLPVPGSGRASVNGNAPLTAMNEPQAPVSTQSPPALPEAARATSPDHGGEAKRPASSASSLAKPSVGNGYGALGKFDSNLRPPPGETASLLVAPPAAGTVPPDENPATLLKIAIGGVSTEPEGTAIAYTITNPTTAPVDLLFIRCNAVDRKGAVVGSAFDYVENIPAGQKVQRVVRMSSEVTASGQTFSCANDAATQ